MQRAGSKTGPLSAARGAEQNPFICVWLAAFPAWESSFPL